MKERRTHMGLKFVNSGSVIVDCNAARRDGDWTLVNNRTMDRINCRNGIAVVDKLRRICPSVQSYLDEPYKPKAPENVKARVFYVSTEDAPALLNLLATSEYVLEWDASRSSVISSGDRPVIRIEYKSDRQLLFQEGDKVVFRDEDTATQSAQAHEEKEA
jgi:hypothetical protein